MNSCICGNSKLFQNCCEPFINGTVKPATAEELMRSRYAAYTIADANYIFETTHVSTKKYNKKSEILAWAKSNKWQKLEILNSNKNTVTFKAHFIDEFGQEQTHFEKSNFVFENKSWFYVDGEFEL